MNSITLESRPLLGKHVRLQTDAVTGEPVLLFAEGILVLNETAREIIVYCDGTKSVRAIVEALGADYEMTVEQLSIDVLECVRDLHLRKLVAFA